MEAWGLGLVTAILNSLFGEAIKDRLKPKSSSEKAREGAFRLYQLLDEIKASSEAFVSALRSYVAHMKKLSARTRDARTEFETFTERQNVHYSDLESAAASLSRVIGEIPSALEAVNPQLRIFNRELVEALKGYGTSRALVLNELEREVSRRFDYEESTLSIKPEQLQGLLSTAENNQQIIEKVLEDMRDFLAKEFTFKESF